MQKLFTILILTIACTIALKAQNNDLCDGTRFIDQVFDEVTITKAVKYGVGTDVLDREFDLLMDVYEPAGDTGEDRPVVIMAHGGSFLFGTRENPYMIQSCTDLAKRGYVAASISYSLWPLVAGIPDSLEMLGVVVDAVGDMKTAMRYFRMDALDMNNEFNINPNLVMVGGLSAGAVMATQVGFMDEDDEKPDFLQTLIDESGGIHGDGDHQGYASNAIAVINLSGGVYRTEWIDNLDTPIFSMHGTADETVPFNHGLAANIMSINGSGSIHPTCEEVDLQNQVIIVEGGGHTDIYTEPSYIEYQEQLVEELYPFLEDLLCNYIVSDQELVELTTKVFPNPSSDFIQFDLALNENIAYDLLVFDRSGKTLFATSNNIGNQFRINKEEVGTGHHFVLVRFKEKYAPITRAIIFE